MASEIEDLKPAPQKLLTCSSCQHWHPLRYGAPFGQCMLSPKMGAAMAIITTNKTSCDGWGPRPE